MSASARASMCASRRRCCRCCRYRRCRRRSRRSQRLQRPRGPRSGAVFSLLSSLSGGAGARSRTAGSVSVDDFGVKKRRSTPRLSRAAIFQSRKGPPRRAKVFRYGRRDGRRTARAIFPFTARCDLDPPNARSPTMVPPRMTSRRLVFSPPAAAFLLVLFSSATLRAENLVVNGDLSRGSGNTPTEWRTDRWDTSSGATEFTWKAPSGGAPGQVGIKNVKPNDARFVQDLKVQEQTWYHIQGKIRTTNVGDAAIGAYLSLMEGFQNTSDVKGTQADWQTVEMWVKTEKWQDRLQLALRLGGYSSLNTGEASFSEISAEPVSGPPPNAKNVYQPAERVGGIAPLGLWALIVL